MNETFDSKAFYAKWARWLTPVRNLLYPCEVSGLENIPEGACLFCGSHSHFADPVLMALAVGGHRPIHFMSKEELFRNKWFGGFLTKLGAFPVDRDGADISAVRTVMKYIRAGEDVGIFPEGTRVDHDGDVQAKTGAAHLAAKLRVPVVPVYISRGKHIFKKARIIFGQPIIIPRDTEDFRKATDDMMEAIFALGK